MLERLLRSMLFEISPADPVTLGAVSVMLVLIAAGAALAPSLRATRVDPVEALRAE
jgi:ABC-type lipoprotein release transport system permease subunit|tara:strand:- start:405 stop:572 length:168 start_codon:yes stop_codon:yes gene_type:complete